MPVRFGTILVFIGLAQSGLAADPAAGTESIPFQVGRHREPLVSVMVNGTGPFVFILDTGSSHSVISDELANALGARAVAKTTMVTVGGERLCAVVRVDRLAIGTLEVSDVLASVLPAALIDGSRPIHGVIGQDVLRTHRYTLDFRKRRIIWNPQTSRRTGDESSFALRLEGERFIVDVPQNGSVLRLVPDSGSEGLVLFQRRNVRLPALTLVPGRAWLSTLTERREVRQVNVQELRIGSASFQNVPAVLVDRSDSDAWKTDGLLPLHLFGRVTLDGPSRLLTIEPRSQYVP